MDRRQSEACLQVTDSLNFGIERILNIDSDYLNTAIACSDPLDVYNKLYSRAVHCTYTSCGHIIINLDRSTNKKEKCTGRAVFTVTQKNWLEYYFQMEKYITKQNRKVLASSLGLTDLQVKVWFQNRRMKWRHSTAATSLSK